MLLNVWLLVDRTTHRLPQCSLELGGVWSLPGILKGLLVTGEALLTHRFYCLGELLWFCGVRV